MTQQLLAAPDSERIRARERTREDIFRLIRSSPNLTRAALVDLTGLPASTVSNAVSKLVSEGRIRRSRVETKGRGSGSGRPAAGFAAVAGDEHVAAIDFGHDHLRVAIGDDLGEPLVEIDAEIDVDLHALEAIELATKELRRLQQALGKPRLGGIVAGIPGPVDRATGEVCSATILSSWVGLSPAAMLSERTGVPVHVENDASLGAYGELMRGAGRGYRDFLYVKASNGIGAGMVIDGELYTGALGLAGEVGHTQLPDRSELCRCGTRGCLEAVVSVPALREQLSHTHPHMHAPIDLAAIDDPVSRRLLDESGRILGGVLANACNLMNPAAIVIGGELGTTGATFTKAVGHAIARHAQPAIAARVEVLPARLGTRAELIGGLLLAAHRVTV